jgi:acetyltransferase AlgX (SGNH hydrolase-like protein)
MMPDSSIASEPTLPKPISRRGPIYARLALALVSVAVVLFGFSAWVWFQSSDEGEYRRGYSPLTAEWQNDDAWVADPYIGKTMRPGVVVGFTNELGHPFAYKAEPIGANGVCFRDNPTKTPVWALAVGDSFVFGHKVALENAWTERLEAAIGRDVVNLGLSGGAPTQYLRNFEVHGAPLRPRVVIMVTFVNDWIDEACFQTWWAARQTLGSQIDFPRSNAIFESVRKNAYRLPPDWKHPPLGGTVECEIDGENYLFDASAYAAQDTRSTILAEGKASAERAIVALRDAASRIGAKLIVVTIPAKTFVYHNQAAALLPYVRKMPSDTFCNEVASWCKKNEIICLDMLPIFRERAAAGQKPFFPRDSHLREEGNQILADEIYRDMKDNGLLPK